MHYNTYRHIKPHQNKEFLTKKYRVFKACGYFSIIQLSNYRDTENLSSPEVAECLDFIYNMYNVDHVAKPWNAEDFIEAKKWYYE